METKIIQIANDTGLINRTNALYEKFNWNVTNVHITDNQDSHVERSYLQAISGYETVVTTTRNYATITYQRDNKISNYDKIVTLENEYVELSSQYSNLSESFHSLPYSLGFAMKAAIWFIFFPVVCPVTIIRFNKYKSGEPERKSKMVEIEERQKAILSEVSTY